MTLEDMLLETLRNTGARIGDGDDDLAALHADADGRSTGAVLERVLEQHVEGLADRGTARLRPGIRLGLDGEAAAAARKETAPPLGMVTDEGAQVEFLARFRAV